MILVPFFLAPPSRSQDQQASEAGVHSRNAVQDPRDGSILPSSSGAYYDASNLVIATSSPRHRYGHRFPSQPLHDVDHGWEVSPRPFLRVV